MSTIDMQHVVDELARELGQSVLIEDFDQRPVWWSTTGDVDLVRQKTILYRLVDEPTASVMDDYHIKTATEPVATPAIPSLEMWPRWFMPIRSEGKLLGYLCVLNPNEDIGGNQVELIKQCAEQAAIAMTELNQAAKQQFTRDELLARLIQQVDTKAAVDLIALEGLRPDTQLGVNIPANPSGWVVGNELSVHVIEAEQLGHTSGSGVPVHELSVAVYRAQKTIQAINAGARVVSPTWSQLGAWRLVVEADPNLKPEDIHPGVAPLLDDLRTDLRETARIVLDNGGDVTATAAQMYVHRTTLYYRLDKIQELTEVDLRTDPSRTDLQLALWLAAFRAQN